ncbi:unnamed protein product [Lepeophtheirus salmonis]|uniref:(salmon louse) hypothetical protein n=1 Tax=Lepeophtheirus salmonis TaxID=72036 RepID=A0A817FCU0_LEPSM|nr:unnamed protein product [Lepeophtheirus salmonis]CAG9476429.1 unnamed protein product [Lepeophtheirus salmonis]
MGLKSKVKGSNNYIFPSCSDFNGVDKYLSAALQIMAASVKTKSKVSHVTSLVNANLHWACPDICCNLTHFVQACIVSQVATEVDLKEAIRIHGYRRVKTNTEKVRLVRRHIIKHKFLKTLSEGIKIAMASQVSLSIEAMGLLADLLTTQISLANCVCIEKACPNKDKAKRASLVRRL